ncbi:hypothetical protein BpHYR1_027594 [Brachionus plicatilis]|uniref:Uncharacterized protein n=1 Tax=Brachionus plicatilis TaxID=10195 RepID=A0A3M7PI53_BRAPC|nr:hypothetical protein BpHYR1_027594 [Brachionus plicatilis]
MAKQSLFAFSISVPDFNCAVIGRSHNVSVFQLFHHVYSLEVACKATFFDVCNFAQVRQLAGGEITNFEELFKGCFVGEELGVHTNQLSGFVLQIAEFYPDLVIVGAKVNMLLFGHALLGNGQLFSHSLVHGLDFNNWLLGQKVAPAYLLFVSFELFFNSEQT